MTAYPYRAYRRRRARRGDSAGPVLAAVALAGMLAMSGAKAAHHGTSPARDAAAGAAAVQAIAYARAQLGKPYCWGGTGGGCYDCSGLVMEAYASAGVRIARTSQDQWATGRHVAGPRPGDLVFYPGADGTWAAPGHVALVIGGGKMIEAYATGWPVRVTAIRPGAVGYTQPWGP